MALIAERAGYVPVRVGGNSQDTATLVESLPDGGIVQKDKADSSNPVRLLFPSSAVSFVLSLLPQTETPTLIFTPDVIYMLNNASALVNIRWYLGTF